MRSEQCGAAWVAKGQVVGVSRAGARRSGGLLANPEKACEGMRLGVSWGWARSFLPGLVGPSQSFSCPGKLSLSEPFSAALPPSKSEVQGLGAERGARQVERVSAQGLSS